jgi:RimJ/RimL family protein N-acetyltransferase
MNDGRKRFGWLRRRAAEGFPVELGDLVREGRLVCLRRHVPANREPFQRWYADEEIARLLRHDQRPLTDIQSRGYFDNLILPMSARGLCYAIHETATQRLVGTTALTDLEGSAVRSAYFRIVIGERECWGRGYGTEATRLVMREAFERHGIDCVRLEVFRHNPRAIRVYEQVGFVETGEHVEFVGRERWELHVVEMELRRQAFERAQAADAEQAVGDAMSPGSVSETEGLAVIDRDRTDTDRDNLAQNPRSYAG